MEARSEHRQRSDERDDAIDRAGEDEVVDRAALEDGSRLEDAQPLAKLAASAWIRGAGWAASRTLRLSRRMASVALARESPLDVIRDARAELVESAQRLLGVDDLEQRVGGAIAGGREDDRSPRESLRDRGAELLERSSGLGDDGDYHPAYARILSELSPDEARILRLLATAGPQAAVDVRTWRPLDLGSEIVAPGLTMIARYAGLIRPDRLPAYLSNLYRLGLIWFSRESLPDPEPYQVLEAQPEVTEAVREAGRARIVRRSIHLTPFGGHFCKLALPLDTAEIEALPALE